MTAWIHPCLFSPGRPIQDSREFVAGFLSDKVEIPGLTYKDQGPFREILGQNPLPQWNQQTEEHGLNQHLDEGDGIDPGPLIR
jgi:hypothetical protein